LRTEIIEDIKKGNSKMPKVGPFSDTLITSIINSAKENRRPVYLAATLYQTEVIEKYTKEGSKFGLVTRIDDKKNDYSKQIKKQVKTWLNKFRTGGLTSWKLKYGKDTSSGRWLAINYGESLKLLIQPVTEYYPESRLPLFNWYKKYILEILPEEKIGEINSVWCGINDIKEIRDWCNNRL
jgi:hypothetical protein